MTALAILAADGGTSTTAILVALIGGTVAVITGSFGFAASIASTRQKVSEQFQTEFDRERKRREEAEAELDNERKRRREAEQAKYLAERQRDQLRSRYEGS